MQAWDIFCRVVDNYGDAGVAWRLARQLAREHALQVRLWIDEPAALARMCPQLDAALGRQTEAGVQVWHWDAQVESALPAEVVIEAFGCELPPAYVARMARQARRPVWINLEYLSAEAWVGRARALEQLKRTVQAAQAWREVESRFPGSIHARLAASRLLALGTR